MARRYPAADESAESGTFSGSASKWVSAFRRRVAAVESHLGGAARRLRRREARRRKAAQQKAKSMLKNDSLKITTTTRVARRKANSSERLLLALLLFATVVGCRVCLPLHFGQFSHFSLEIIVKRVRRRDKVHAQSCARIHCGRRATRRIVLTEFPLMLLICAFLRRQVRRRKTLFPTGGLAMFFPVIFFSFFFIFAGRCHLRAEVGQISNQSRFGCDVTRVVGSQASIV